jgi:LmbE family N-acetylglucosaminyl deacetylase
MGCPHIPSSPFFFLAAGSALSRLRICFLSRLCDPDNSAFPSCLFLATAIRPAQRPNACLRRWPFDRGEPQLAGAAAACDDLGMSGAAICNAPFYSGEHAMIRAISVLAWAIGTILSGMALAAEPADWRRLEGAEAKAVAAERPSDGKLRIIVFGAHPDDAEIRAGGTAALWSAAGHHVQLVSCTNGDVGHFQMRGPALAARRLAEVEAADRLLGATTRVLDIHDGELMPTLENRRTFTRLIRAHRADIVIAHRPNDYHPDHRYTGVLVQDSAYMVTVPFFCPDEPYLRDNPVFLYSADSFERPNPFRADVAVAIDAVIEKKLDALLKMESQFIEGGANGYRVNAPADGPGRDKLRQQAREGFRRRAAAIADRHREKLVELYGAEAGKAARYAEAFEICEYGRRPSGDELRKLFPLAVEKPQGPAKE